MRTILTLGAAVALIAGPALAQAPAPELPDSYAAAGDGISYFNTPNRRHTILNGAEPTALGKVTIDLKRPADVLVQFTSGLATVSEEGRPCSVRASPKIDDQPAVVIKRVNLGGRVALAGQPYQPDRQSADGSFVFRLPAGRHEATLLVQRIDGQAKVIQAFYANIQAIAFPRR